MIGPPIPVNETARLAALRSYRILDTPAEESFDRLTRLASRVLGVPIALVSLVDESRQWFKSRVGLEAAETPRRDAFCAFTIVGTEIMEVNDARQDPRFASNPLVLGPPHIRFYAGAPLVTSDGSIGTLCVIDQQPRRLSDVERQILADLASVTRDTLDMRITVAQAAAVRGELERSNQDLDQFASLTSHDLQEPLRTVANLSLFLSRRYAQDLDGVGRESLELMGESVDRMQQLIEAVLTYSRLGKSRELRTVDLGSVVVDVLQDLSAAVKKSDARIHLGVMPTVHVCESEIRLLFQNLIGNALKFKRPHVAPEVVISAEEDTDEWRFAVTDNGIGINSEDFERIFLIFQRLHSRKTYGGTGIGLAHCLRIVESHRGKIWVESREREGSTFFFTLPKGEESLER